ncbi:hypothetical protein [Nonomuraea dietziae]|uniref:hypothetical protein n=1 Tax=Nonomuraea dietziae TaxID=65515 RepID=UPI00342290D2
MSDDVLSVIPTDPHWQPGKAAADRAASIVADLAPGTPGGVDAEIDVTWHDRLTAVDCGQNLERSTRPYTIPANVRGRQGHDTPASFTL